METLTGRVKICEEDIDELKNRPVATGGGVEIDYSLLCSKEQYMGLLARIEAQEKRNMEQDTRLTDDALRLDKLEKAISDPMERIMQIEVRLDAMNIELNNKVNV